ncbi:MAG TPA: PRC-barrel domain-containing protein [Sphingomonadaceae bacterium]|nr:PRC-barrel domain-containing protein [Sphingomonadaceae bacterium]
MNDQNSSGAEQPLAGSYPLISARIDDMSVFDVDGRKIGSFHAAHIDRNSGRIEFALLSIGGFLGLGQSYHPVPFGTLRFDEKLGGYVVAISKALLDGGPSYRPDNAPTWDAAYARRLSDYYASV